MLLVFFSSFLGYVWLLDLDDAVKQLLELRKVSCVQIEENQYALLVFVGKGYEMMVDRLLKATAANGTFIVTCIALQMAAAYKLTTEADIYLKTRADVSNMPGYDEHTAFQAAAAINSDTLRNQKLGVELEG